MSVKLSTKGRYGLRAMIDLAERFGEGPVLVKSIADRQEISSKYLHALLASLKSAKLVRSVRGSGGGYTLAKAPPEINIGEILEALEGPFAIVDCVLNDDICNRADRCAVRNIWVEISQDMENKLKGITLETLATDQQARDKAFAKVS